MNNLEIALDAREKGLVAIPCHPGTKVPKVLWKEWQTKMPPLDLQASWFEDTRVNIAILTGGLVIFDCDDPARADLVLDQCGDTPHKLRSPRQGIHLGYRRRRGVEVTNQVRIKGMPIDIRTDGGLEMIPYSETEDGQYEWLTDGLHAISELPVAKVGWTRERTRKKLITTVTPMEVADPYSLLGRGQLYVNCFERAEEGNRGHTKLYIAACKIVRWCRNNAGGDERLMWDLLLWFNETKADPPWDLNDPAERKQLEHKFRESLKNARR